MARPKQWLPPAQQVEAECLKDEGWSVEEIAVELNATQDAVRTALGILPARQSGRNGAARAEIAAARRDVGPETAKKAPVLLASPEGLSPVLMADTLRDDEAHLDTLLEELMQGHASRESRVVVRGNHKIANGRLAHRVAREAAETQMGKHWWELSYEQKVWWVRIAARFVLAQDLVLERGFTGSRVEERLERAASG